MKFFKFLLLFLAAIIFTIYACKKNLNQPSQGGLTEQDLANKAGVEGLLIGAYSLLDGAGSSNSDVGSAASNWLYGSICGSEAYTGSVSGALDPSIEKFQSTATDVELESKWAIVYDGVARANEVLRVMELASDISPYDQIRITAEARFLRGFYHFEAKKMWNNVPYIDETVTYTNNNYHVANNKDIWPDIENDFRYAADNLFVKPYQGAIGRASKYPAMAFLAKAYMFEKKFAQAKPLLDSIINSGHYRLEENYHDNFNAETKKINTESVFSAQMSVNDGGGGSNGNSGDVYNFPNGGGPGGCCGFFQPSQYLVNHFKTDSITGLPDLDHYNDVDVKSDQGISSDSSFVPYAGALDPRLDWTVGRRGIPYLDWGNHPGAKWIRDQNNGGPYSPKKNVFYQSQEGHFTDVSFWSNNLNANNVNLIRYADVLLWAAETEVEIGSFLNKAEEYVNMVRNRAANPNSWVYTYADPNDPSKGFTNTPAANYFAKPYPDGYFQSHGQAFARKAVYYERMLESGMEGHRFFDLVRWGIADTEINTYIQKEKNLRRYFNGVTFKSCNDYFAIPQSQIDLSAGADGIPLMIQNPCY